MYFGCGWDVNNLQPEARVWSLKMCTEKSDIGIMAELVASSVSSL